MRTTYRPPWTDDERALVATFEHEFRVLMALKRREPHAAADSTIDHRRMTKAHRRAIEIATVRVACLSTEINDHLRPTEA
jgi:hypothetical protein